MDTRCLTLDAPDGCPKYLRLAKTFERQLRTGVLRVGDRLPSIRQLRDDHQVSVATAVGCYVWLERQGYVRARPKSGYYVSRAPLGDGPPPDVARRMRAPVSVQMARATADAGIAAAHTGTIDLGPAVISPALLPTNRLNKSTRMALSAFGDAAVRYEDASGNLRLRRQVARLMFRQGATCAPEDIIITSGSTEALNLSIRAATRPGDLVAVESPGCYETLQILESLHLRALEIPHVPGEGVNLSLLASAVRKHRVAALITTATCHNPLGDCVGDDSKAEIVAFATRHDITIVEGDVFGDLIFSGERPRPLKAFDTAGIVMQCSSLAHHVAPGFNLGWAAPGRLHPEFERLKRIGSVANARLPQLAMAEFLESGGFDRHMKHLRVALWEAVETARADVLSQFPAGTRVSRPEGGFVLWIQLPDGHDGVEVKRRAAEAGVNILAGAAFSPNGQYANCIRIACGHPLDVLRGAVRTLADLLARRN